VMRLLEHLPDCAGYVELDRVGHMAPLEAADAIAAGIRDLAGGRTRRRSEAASSEIT
jgi:pimeloyl-ACP methyl ester carboxylesterase